MTVDKNNILKQISEIGMIPVLTIDKKERALPLAKALSKGGLPLMEVMLRSEDALACIEIISNELSWLPRALTLKWSNMPWSVIFLLCLEL